MEIQKRSVPKITSPTNVRNNMTVVLGARVLNIKILSK